MFPQIQRDWNANGQGQQSKQSITSAKAYVLEHSRSEQRRGEGAEASHEEQCARCAGNIDMKCINGVGSDTLEQYSCSHTSRSISQLWELPSEREPL